MSVIKITKDNFNEVTKTDKKVLIDLYADWCGPCRMVGPIVEELAEEHPEYVFGKVNVDEEAELAMRFRVMSIPMLVVLEDGEVVNSAVGARPKAAILELLRG